MTDDLQPLDLRLLGWIRLTANDASIPSVLAVICERCAGKAGHNDPRETLGRYRACNFCCGTGISPIPFKELGIKNKDTWRVKCDS